MTLNAESLLTGPRGRGLLVHLYDDAAIRNLNMRADFAAQQGTMAMVYMHAAPTPGVRGLVDSVRSRRERAKAQREHRRPVSPTELAEAIAAAPLPSIGNAALVEALARSVDDAKAWQPPDGSEAVIASDAVRAALTPLAERVVSSPFVREWAARAQAQQWVLDRKDDRLESDPHPVPEPVPAPADALATWRQAVEAEEREYVESRERGEVSSGTWWSTPPDQITRSTAAWPDFGPAGLYLQEDSFGPMATRATPVGAPPEKTYEIANAEAWAQLCRDYPLDVTASREHVWGASIGSCERWAIPDWQAVAVDWEAAHLTIAGYLAAATAPIEVSGGIASTIAGWGPDETVWLRHNPAPTSAAFEWRHYQQVGWRQTSEILDKT